MTNIDNINKEGLFSMVKRITEENSSYVNKLPLKTGQFPKNILLHIGDKNYENHEIQTYIPGSPARNSSE